MENSSCNKKHFVLVHGSCHGAWCWYKLKPLLEAVGHRVTVLDMAASGINLKRIDDVQTLADYSEPLIEFMESLPSDQRVILVGHSFGGITLSLVMEMFPQKIEVAVFLTAFVPDTQHTPSFIFEQFNAKVKEVEGGQQFWLDTDFKCSGGGDEQKEVLTSTSSMSSMLFGPQFLAKLYHLSPTQDLELSMALRRPGSMFIHDLSREESKLSTERYGSVRRVYVICDEDRGIPLAFQRWMIENNGFKEVKELKGSDHMPMFCMPQQLCDCLLEIMITQN